MTKIELGARLKEMYESAPKNRRIINVHLFGIKYASTIKKNSYNTEELISISGINKSYKNELDKGLELSKFVKVHN